MATRNEIRCDLLVIGGGIAAAFAAIKARERGVKVVLVDKAFFGRSGCSALASGVYRAYMPGDDLEAWLEEACSTPLVNRTLAERAILKTNDCLMEMDRWGVKWIKEGGWIMREFGGGGGLPFKTNAMMAEGGLQMMMALRGQAIRMGVQIVNRVMMTDLLTNDGAHPTEGSVVGAVGFEARTAEPWVFESKATVVATGPYRFPYPPSGGGFAGMPINASADGIAMMLRAGAILGKFEMGGGSPHPHEFQCAPGLEMLGGLGCKFVDAEGKNLFSMSPNSKPASGNTLTQNRRSALGHNILRETRAARHAYLDCTHFTPEQHRLVKQVVPIVIHTFERAGYDLSKDRVPYSSALALVHGGSGCGARINGKGETSLAGLYAAGICSDGGYIRMGQALPEASVVGAWAGESAAEFTKECAENVLDQRQVESLVAKALAPLNQDAGQKVSFGVLHSKLENFIVKDIDHILNGGRLDHALETVGEIKAREVDRLAAADPHELAKVHALKNFIECFEPAARVVLRRTESRGNVLRDDYPFIDNSQWAKFTVFRKEAESVRIWEEPLPEDRPRVEKAKIPHPFFR